MSYEEILPELEKQQAIDLMSTTMPPNTKKCCEKCWRGVWKDCGKASCPCHTPAVEEWEKADEFIHRAFNLPVEGTLDTKKMFALLDDYHSFITSLRESDRKRIVEGLKGMMSSDDKWSKRHQEQVLWTDIGYNQAISDAITLITNLK